MSDVVKLHHLSDVHIGPLHYRPSNKLSLAYDDGGLPRNTALYLEYLHSLVPDTRPHIVVISGDMTSYATEDQMNQAQDFIRDVVKLLREGSPSWRPDGTPCVLIVPGNHDLDWSKDDHAARIERFARMATALADAGDVISASYRDTTNADSFHDFGDEANIFLYLFDSTPLGGTNDPRLAGIHEALAENHKTIARSNRQSSEFAKALDALNRAAHRDPGYVEPRALTRMKKVLEQVPARRVKIAVMHHNLSSVPSDDVEEFDAIINSGIVKATLVECGFDLVLHGHRHFRHFSFERKVGTSPDGAVEPDMHRGLHIIGADSLGVKEHAPFLEIVLRDVRRAHDADPPATTLEIRAVQRQGTSYSLDARPVVEEVIGRPLHLAVNELLRRLGRPLNEADRKPLFSAVEHILPHVQSLVSDLVGWGTESGAWIEKFHYLLGSYSRIYAVDIGTRMSSDNPRFDRYLREQFDERLKRLTRTESRTLTFSPPVYKAIIQTGWRPEPAMWEGRPIAERKGRSGRKDLEIVRIMVRGRAPQGREIDALWTLDFDHRHYAVPLFVVDASRLAKRLADSAIGFDADGHPLKCYQFNDKTGAVEEVAPVRGGPIVDSFVHALGSSELQTIAQYLGERVMIRDPEELRAFARRYDSTRQASPLILDVLDRHLPRQDGQCGVDIGCGTGNYTIPFQNRFDRLTGLDISDEMLEVARAKSNKITWLRANAFGSHMPDGSADAVWLISTLHYFIDGQQEALFREIRRLLKPGGLLLADIEFTEQHKSLWVVEYFPSLRARYAGSFQSVDEYTAALTRAGFRSVDTEVHDVPADDPDSAIRVGQHEPRRYLDEQVRDGIPAFVEMTHNELSDGVGALERAIGDGSIEGVMEKYAAEATLEGDVGILIARA
jgi:ubiquinone/menaquinone biosynthesis C-methylase UbiE/3',5'-cyclic AMP phosphodiesterase CpdA